MSVSTDFVPELIPSTEGSPWIGRCPAKGCKTTARIMVERRHTGRTDRFGNHFTEPAIRHTWRKAIDFVRADGTGPADHTYSPIVEVFEWEVFEQVSTLGRAPEAVFPRCIEHDRKLRFQPIKGRYVDSVPCDARCTNARGPNCDCSCGGANHGSSYQ